MRSIIPLFLILGSACSSDPTGIWLVTLTPDAGGVQCSETITENFSRGQEPEESTSEGWTTEESQSFAQELAFMEILETVDQQSVLVWGDEAWPGIWNASYWEFTWSDSSDESSSLSHAGGYSYLQSGSESIVDTIDWNTEKNTTTGELLTTSTSQTVWEESDIWNESVASEIGQTGSIPANSYLVELIPGAEAETAVNNSYSTPECESNPCRIQLDTTCAQLWSFTAVRTQAPPDSGYVDLAGSGQ
jgi:hypothetical protein